LIRLLDRRPAQRLRRMSYRARIVSGLCGFRGAVSLAAALGVPLLLSSGEPFPERDMLVFVTAGVIVVTIVVQGILLPLVLRWAALARDTTIDQEKLLAQRTAAEEVLMDIDRLAAQLNTEAPVTERLRQEYATHLRVLDAGAGLVEAEEELRHHQQYTALRLAVLENKRATMVRLRNEEHIDDTVLRQLQSTMDAEELRLAPEDLTE
jgi:CPA1 family monovalent cation:H+ antiporter